MKKVPHPLVPNPNQKIQKINSESRVHYLSWVGYWHPCNIYNRENYCMVVSKVKVQFLFWELAFIIVNSEGLVSCISRLIATNEYFMWFTKIYASFCGVNRELLIKSRSVTARKEPDTRGLVEGTNANLSNLNWIFHI